MHNKHRVAPLNPHTKVVYINSAVTFHDIITYDCPEGESLNMENV